jgi:hypothetical protein
MKRRIINQFIRTEKQEFLVPRGADISQPAYRPLNQRRIIRTQSILDKKRAK